MPAEILNKDECGTSQTLPARAEGGSRRVREPWGLTLRPEIAAISMSGSSVLVAVNALSLKRLRLPSHSSGRRNP